MYPKPPLLSKVAYLTSECSYYEKSINLCGYSLACDNKIYITKSLGTSFLDIYSISVVLGP